MNSSNSTSSSSALTCFSLCCRSDAASAPFAFLSSCTSAFFSSRLFKSLQFLHPVAFTRLPLRPFQRPHRLTRPALHHTFLARALELPSLPINLSLSPFPSYITPPPLSPPSLTLPQSASACLTGYPLACPPTMPPQRPTHPRLHVQNTFDALKVLVSPAHSPPCFPLTSTNHRHPGGSQNRRAATRHTTPHRSRTHLLDPFWLYIRLEGE